MHRSCYSDNRFAQKQNFEECAKFDCGSREKISSQKRVVPQCRDSVCLMNRIEDEPSTTMTSPTRKRARVDDMLTMLPSRQCASAAQAITRLAPFQTFCKIIQANVGATGDAKCVWEAEVLRFFDTALDERHNTISVVVGGDASGKNTKLRALVYAAGGRARFVSGDHFHNELLARADIYLDSPQRPIVVIAGSSRDLPPIEEDDAELSLDLPPIDYEAEQPGDVGKINLGGKGASVALAIDDENDLFLLSWLGLRVNVLRLDEDEDFAPAADSAATDGRKHVPQRISHADMVPLLRTGGPLFAAWRALECAQRSLQEIQEQEQRD
jgi:hypothetical protein